MPANHYFKKDNCCNENLTQREMACLAFASNGKSVKETASLLGISYATVRQYRKNIFRKLNCENMTRAIIVGIKHGLIDIRNI